MSDCERTLSLLGARCSRTEPPYVIESVAIGDVSGLHASHICSYTESDDADLCARVTAEHFKLSSTIPLNE